MFSKLGVLVSLLLATLVLAAPAAGSAIPASAGGHAHGQDQQTMSQASLGQMPLAFEVNRGQTDSQVSFLAHGSGYTLFLAKSSAVLTLGSTQPQRSIGHQVTWPRASAAIASAQTASQTVRMAWAGANPNPAVTGEQPLPGITNYLIGNDPAQWRTDIPTYAQVRYHDVYPGIDLLFYGKAGALEYDFVVAPGADPARVRLAFSGMDGGNPAALSLDSTGSLALALGAQTTLQQPRPQVYQEIAGSRHAVDGGFRLLGNGMAGFSIGAYNPALPLVIDPLIRYSTFLGGSSWDWANGIAVDATGNAYVTGVTSSTDFPTASAEQSHLGGTNGKEDVFVSKIIAAGGGYALQYSTYLGGSSDDEGDAIAVDSSGSAYITGTTYSTDFPTHNALQSSLKGTDCCGYGGDVFVTKLSSAGNALTYSTYVGGSGGDVGHGIAVDASGNAYVTGYTFSGDFPTHNAYQSTFTGWDTVNEEGFVFKLNAAGSAFSYSTYLGATQGSPENPQGGADGYGIAVDGSGEAYVTGVTDTIYFPVTVGAYQTTLSPATDKAFITKFNANGTGLVYSTYLGGSKYAQAQAIAVDASGHAFVGGYTYDTDFPTHNAAQATYGGGTEDGFVTEMNSTGGGLVYSTYLGGSGTDNVKGLALDPFGHAVVAGYTGSTDFPTANALEPTCSDCSGGYSDAFVTRYSTSGGILYSSYIGGSGGDQANAVAVNIGGDAYVAGQTFSNGFPTLNALQGTCGGCTPGYSDAFITKVMMRPTPVDTAGVYFPSNAAFYLRTSNSAGNANIIVPFGPTNCQPLVGDWNGKGYDSIGIDCNGTFYLRNANSGGNANIAFNYGAPGWIPIAGDWTGKGYDSVGLYDPSTSTFYLRNANAGGNANYAFRYGPPGSIPVVGDWTSKGYDSVGVYYPPTGVFYLKNSNAGGNADLIVAYGPHNATPVTGDWTGQGFDTLGVYYNGVFYLRDSDSAGPADQVFAYGASSAKPVMGLWVGPTGGVAHR